MKLNSSIFEDATRNSEMVSTTIRQPKRLGSRGMMERILTTLSRKCMCKEVHKGISQVCERFLVVCEFELMKGSG